MSLFADFRAYAITRINVHLARKRDPMFLGHLRHLSFKRKKELPTSSSPSLRLSVQGKEGWNEKMMGKRQLKNLPIGGGLPPMIQSRQSPLQGAYPDRRPDHQARRDVVLHEVPHQCISNNAGHPMARQMSTARVVLAAL
ncbi:hypothetical protein AB5N19_02795 [Seiridium cardinale]